MFEHYLSTILGAIRSHIVDYKPTILFPHILIFNFSKVRVLITHYLIILEFRKLLMTQLQLFLNFCHFQDSAFFILIVFKEKFLLFWIFYSFFSSSFFYQ